MKMTNNEFNLIKYLMYCVEHFNERSTRYENCFFCVKPVSFILSDEVIGFDIFYGNDICKFKSYVGLKVIEDMKREDILLSWFEDKAKMVAKETYKKTGI